MDGKRIRCLRIVPLHVPIYLLPFLRYSEIFVKKSSFYHTPLHSTPPLGGFPSEYRHPLWDGKTRMVSLPDGRKISRISLFVLTWSTNVTDRRTLDDSKDRACIASRGKNGVASRQWKRFDDIFARFDIISACEIQKDRRTDILRQHRAVKTRDSLRPVFSFIGSYHDI